MLQRIPEPEVMDSAAEASDYDAMDHAAVNRLFAADFLAVWNGGCPILDVGTGTAQIPIELCRQSPSAHVVAIDLAEHMLALARTNIERAGLVGRIRVERANGREMPYGSGSFPAVMSNSIIHHIPEPGHCFAEIARVAAPAATIFVRDLLRPGSEAELRRLVNAYAGDGNAHQRKMFAESLHAALTLDEVCSYVDNLGFDPAGVQQTSDRHWTWIARTRNPS